MSKWFNINYLRAPEMGKAASTGAAFGAIGDSLMKLGAIGAAREKIDTENKRRAEDVAFRDSELAFRKDVHKDDMDFKNKDFIFRQGAHRDDMNARTNQLNWEMEKFGKEQDWNKMKFYKELLMDEKKLGIEAVKAKNTADYYAYLKSDDEYKRKKQEAEDRVNVAIYREMFPEQSKNKSDIEILALGKIMQNFQNNKKEGHDELVKVPWEFHKEHGHLNVTKITKDGVYAYKWFIDGLAKEAEAMSEAKGNQAGYKDRVNNLKKSKPLIFGDDGAM
ncbi:hypothetical protein [Campylobacter sp. RM16188]|uniref:hypothetical protein n=1 Tax=Campylobacter sp. RM16188 TaxID=1705725 RepID=UPI0015538755|nr:hypothetical protein [Campylobacter sp. RM16188]